MIKDFNYPKAIQQANAIANAATQLRNLANGQYEQAIGEVQNAWAGDTARAFLQQCMETKRELLKKAQELDELANAIRKIAKRIEDAEQEARRIAKANG